MYIYIDFIRNEFDEIYRFNVKNPLYFYSIYIINFYSICIILLYIYLYLYQMCLYGIDYITYLYYCVYY